MARWTKTRDDLVRISKVQTELPMFGIVSIRLIDGSNIEGVIRGTNFGNNAGRGGWHYYGEYELESLDRQRWVIDVLDIESAHSVWDSRHAEYEAAGLITIVR